jgi:hypothetical protein
MLLNVMGEDMIKYYSEHPLSTPTDPIITQFYIVIFFVIMFLLWLFRSLPIIGGIWKIVSMFFIVLFLTLFFNYAKKEIKIWWDND